MTTLPLKLLFPDGDPAMDPLGAKEYARELERNDLKAIYELPVWKVDDDCYLVLHYGKSLLNGYRYLLDKNVIDDELEIDVELFEGSLDHARQKAKLPAPIKKTSRKRSEHRRLSPDELRAFLESLPLPTSRNGYQAGIVHGLTFVVRGIEPTEPEWIRYTQGAKRDRISRPPKRRTDKRRRER